MKVAIVTDSTAYLSQEYCQQNDITVLPLTISFGDASYYESIDIKFEAFYQKLANTEKIPTSSQPSVGNILAEFERLSKDYDHILAFTLSKEISGTYQTMMMVGNEITDAQVSVFDSTISCQPQAFLVEAATRLIKSENTIEAVIAELESLKSSMDAYFIVDDLAHLRRGGRLSAPAVMAGSLLRVKPVLTFVDGNIVVFDKIRTLNKAIGRIEDLFDHAYQKSTLPLKVTIETAPNVPAVSLLKQYLNDNYSDVTVTINEIGPVIGTHLGPGAFGMGWIVDDEKKSM